MAGTLNRRMEMHYSRKAGEQCTRLGCGAAPVGDAQLCERHLADARESNRQSMRRTRQTRRADGLCAECGKVKSETYRCAGCAVRLGRIPSTGVDGGVDVEVSEEERWRRDNDGWARYRGRMRRGKPPVADTDREDLEYAMRSLQRALEGLAYARRPEVAALPRIQRAAVEAEWVAHVGHAARFCEDIQDRHKAALRRKA